MCKAKAEWAGPDSDNLVVYLSISLDDGSTDRLAHFTITAQFSDPPPKRRLRSITHTRAPWPEAVGGQIRPNRNVCQKICPGKGMAGNLSASLQASGLIVAGLWIGGMSGSGSGMHAAFMTPSMAAAVAHDAARADDIGDRYIRVGD